MDISPPAMNGMGCNDVQHCTTNNSGMYNNQQILNISRDTITIGCKGMYGQ